MRRPILSFLLVLAASSTCVPSIARAQQAERPADGDAARAQARVHFDRGIELWNEERYDAALAELARAYELAPAFPVLYNLGRVHVALGQPVEAVRAFEAYLREGGDAVPAARRREVEVELGRQRDRIGFLAVEVDVPGAIVSIDGVDVASVPLAEPLPLGAGAHTVGVRAPGHGSITRAVQIAGRVTLPLRVALPREFAAHGTLRIASDLPDVLVRVDGVEVGRTPLATTVPVDAGDHEIVGTRPGYLPDAQRVRVAEHAELEVRLRMDVDPSPGDDVAGTVALHLPSASYALRIDGRERTPQSRLSLPIGAHTIAIEATDRQPWQDTVHVRPGLVTDIAPPLVWTPSARSARVSSADTQRTAGQVTTFTFGAVLLVGIPMLIVNELDIADTDAEVVDLTRRERACSTTMMMGSPECIAVRDRLLELPDRQATQDVLRAVSIGATIAGALGTVLGVVLWATAPSEDDIDAAAHVRLSFGPSGLRLTGAF